MVSYNSMRFQRQGYVLLATIAVVTAFLVSYFRADRVTDSVNNSTPYSGAGNRGSPADDCARTQHPQLSEHEVLSQHAPESQRSKAIGLLPRTILVERFHPDAVRLMKDLPEQFRFEVVPVYHGG